MHIYDDSQNNTYFKNKDIIIRRDDNKKIILEKIITYDKGTYNPLPREMKKYIEK